jgi:transcriptional regulator with XRE-family HTH domain
VNAGVRSPRWAARATVGIETSALLAASEDVRRSCMRGSLHDAVSSKHVALAKHASITLSADLALCMQRARCNTRCMSTELDFTPAIPPETLGLRMERARRAAGVGVQEMATYLDVARNTVSTWLHDRVRPSDQTLRLWALRCGVSLDWLRTGQVPLLPPADATLDESARSSTDRASDYGSLVRFPSHRPVLTLISGRAS